ncbi:hypothetical protein [Archangium lansingense]|uniref:Uncharacterized protein n=1 Tax=Archangium lansingense TaxID=2995310 RepID=A0ABT4AQG1_9BACT|nr:hypothetical protein [Archangium lansinium]MCY1083017.1 hypothetical protein [Archangium lansinium]
MLERIDEEAVRRAIIATDISTTAQREVHIREELIPDNFSCVWKVEPTMRASSARQYDQLARV